MHVLCVWHHLFSAMMTNWQNQNEGTDDQPIPSEHQSVLPNNHNIPLIIQDRLFTVAIIHKERGILNLFWPISWTFRCHLWFWLSHAVERFYLNIFFKYFCTQCRIILLPILRFVLTLIKLIGLFWITQQSEFYIFTYLCEQPLMSDTKMCSDSHYIIAVHVSREKTITLALLWRANEISIFTYLPHRIANILIFVEAFLCLLSSWAWHSSLDHPLRLTLSLQPSYTLASYSQVFSIHSMFFGLILLSWSSRSRKRSKFIRTCYHNIMIYIFIYAHESFFPSFLALALIFENASIMYDSYAHKPILLMHNCCNY